VRKTVFVPLSEKEAISLWESNSRFGNQFRLYVQTQLAKIQEQHD
jgi:hypothetical protein